MRGSGPRNATFGLCDLDAPGLLKPVPRNLRSSVVVAKLDTAAAPPYVTKISPDDSLASFHGAPRGIPAGASVSFIKGRLNNLTIAFFFADSHRGTK